MNFIPEIVQPFVPHAIRMTPVTSDTMEPTLRRGDFVLAVPTDRYEIQGLYLLGEEVFRVQPNGKKGELWLLRDNQRYTRQDVSLEWFNETVMAYVVGHLKVFDHRYFRPTA